jgi:hypothetical protein
MQANFYEARDRFRDALKAIEKALIVSPENETLLKQRGNILWRIAVEEDDDTMKKTALDAWRYVL